MIDSKTELEVMKRYFPSWTDIRKRIDTSIGGALLHAYADEADDIQKAIEEYQRDFFILCYRGKEDTIPAYVYVGLVGNNNSISLTDKDLYIVYTVKEFYDDPKHAVLYQDNCLIIQQEALADKDKDYIEYISQETFKYRSKLIYQHVWNVFDEFALFAGIKRYIDIHESNSDLAYRTLEVFKKFPNSSERGLKNAIQNALINLDKVQDTEIIIESPDHNNVYLDDEEFKTVYERITKYNRDLFRTKIWDTSLWEHSFKKLDYIPHPWDKEPEEYQDGVGCRKDLHVDYVNKINATNTTDLDVIGYVKDTKSLMEYIRNNNTETSIQLDLKKYKNEITPHLIEYKITASEVQEIDPEKIFIEGYETSSGRHEYLISDIETQLENVTRVDRNKIQKNKIYELRFTATEPYSKMEISKCEMKHDSQVTDLREEKGSFVMNQNKILTNKNVLLHCTSLSTMNGYDNLKNIDDGFSVASLEKQGTASFDITDMSYSMLKIKSHCDEVSITDNTELVTHSENFTYTDTNSLTCITPDSTSNIIINMKRCMSFSFDLAENSDAIHQGAIKVLIETEDTVTQKLTSETKVYNKPQHISKEFESGKNVKVTVTKTGQNPVTVKNIKCARYEIIPRLMHGNIINNSMYLMLPKFTGKNYLYIDIICYTQKHPIIDYVHIGNSLIGSEYKIEIDTTNINDDKDIILDIKSTCKVQLYELDKVNNTKTIIDDNYLTYPYYVNNTGSKGYIVIDTSGFTNIESSNPIIEHRYLNSSTDYIELQPGKQIENIVIVGNYKKLTSNNSLSKILFNNNPDYKVFVSRATDSFILKNGSHEELKDLTKDSIPGFFDHVKIITNDNSLTATFVIDESKQIKYIDKEINKQFEKICLFPVYKQEYVAYNFVNMISQEKQFIELVNVFYPILSFTKNYLYILSEIRSEKDPNASVVFVHDDMNEALWSLGVPDNGLTARTTLEFNNTETYELTVNKIYDRYVISSEIALDDIYNINSEQHELMEYIITPPEGLQINYENREYEEVIIAENDLFNKLTYSNLTIRSVKVNNVSLEEDVDYTYLDKEGIIIWTSDKYSGEEATIRYTVKKPVSLSFIDEDTLYTAISYNVNGYKKLDDVNIFNDLKDGETVTPYFSKTPDKIITKVSNPIFQSVLSADNKNVSVIKIADNNDLAVHSGYIYENGLEYYYFCDKYIDETNRMSNIELHNVTRLGDKLLFHMESTNLLPYSNMNCDILYPLCAFDFTKKDFSNISSTFNSLSSCDTLNGWYLYNMSTELQEGINNYCISFTKKNNNRTGYALFDITEYLKKDSIISIWRNNNENIGIVKETKVEGIPLSKSISISEEDIVKFKNYEEDERYSYHVVNYETEPESKYYIIILGECKIDDILITNYSSLKNTLSSHKKNIDRLNIDITEDIVKNSIYSLDFDSVGLSHDNTEVGSDNKKLSTITTVSWGLTNIHNVDLSVCKLNNASRSKDVILTNKNEASIVTDDIYIKSKENIQKIVVKINDVYTKELKGFNVNIYASSSKNGAYEKILTELNTNIVEIKQSLLSHYMRIEIEADKDKIVNSISVYAKYIETDKKDLAILAKDNGTVLTKIYDIGNSGNFKLNNINYETNIEDAITFYVRGYREDNYSIVPTMWYKYEKDKEIRDADKHVFENYRLFQFRIDIDNSEAEVKINSFEMKAS